MLDIPLTIIICTDPSDNLATMPGFANMNGVAVGSDGRADPQSQLFRSTAVGVETGPMISQVGRSEVYCSSSFIVLGSSLDSSSGVTEQSSFYNYYIP